MQVNQILEKIPFLNKVNNVMVCEVDAIGIRASVFVKQGNTLNVSLEAHADAHDLSSGVAELVQQLRKQSWAGKHAVLLTPAVVQQLIELPIPPKNKLMPQQIAESVRWELEPFLTQQLRTLSLGQIMLLQNKHIKPEQIEDILSQQEAANASKNREVLYKKFGELAVELGYASQTQVDKALSKQSWFMGNGDDMLCGWAAQSAKPNPESQLYSWLAVGINKQLLRQWQAAFFAQGVKLESAYPVVGNAIACVDAVNKQTNAQFDELVLEVHEAQLTGIHLQNGVLNTLQTLPLQQNQALSAMGNMFHGMGVEQVDRVSLVDAFSRSETETNRLVDDLQHVIGQPVKSYPKLGYSTNLGLKAAALHFMKFKTNVTLAAVPVGEPLAPLMQRPAVKFALGMLIILGLIALAETTLQVRQYSISSEKEKVDKELAQINTAVSRLQAKVDEVKKLKEGIKEKQEEVKELKKSIDLLSVELPKRNQTLNNFLNELNRTVNEDVVIDGLFEDTMQGFSISAWSISEKSAQEFVKNFQIAVHPLGYKLKDITVTEQTGRLGLLGYALNFNATTLGDEAWKNAKLMPFAQSATTSNIKGGQ